MMHLSRIIPPGAGAPPMTRCGAIVLLIACGLIGCRPEEPPKKPTGGKRGETAGQSSVQFEVPPPTNPLAYRITEAVDPAPKPDKPLPANASCITSACHADIATAKRLHGPLVAGTCEACHEPDAGDHTYPLKRQGDAMCTFCHEDNTNTKPHQHTAVTENGCMACHQPHAAPTKFLLTADSVGALCRSCHNMPIRRFAHTPYAEQQCTVCHFSHQADNAMLLRGGDNTEHCLSCHPGIAQRLAAASQTHEPVAEQCVTCHDAHTSDHPRMLAASVRDGCLACHEDFADRTALISMPHGAMDDDRSCANCHDPHASSVGALLADRQDILCMNCHDQRLETDSGRTVAAMTDVLAMPFLHGPVKSGECSSCHAPHGANHPNLLTEPYPDRFYAPFDLANYGLCFGCHTADLVRFEHTENLTNFRNGDQNLHYLHVHRDEKGRTCKACHAIHGSSHPLHIADAVPFEGSDWPLPIRFEKTADGGGCSPGCHEPMRYSRTAPIVNESAAARRSAP